MAGTDQSRGVLPENFPKGPKIILVRPQLGENIGMCARAMLNCGLTDLRIVAPRDGWPNDAAISAASGAVMVIENAKLYNSTEDAAADLNFIVATTARDRDLTKNVIDPAGLPAALSGHGAAHCGILFGPERTGLHNGEIAMADCILNIPLNPGFSSLNLAQAVLLAGYHWFSSLDAAQPESQTDLASKDKIVNVMKHLTDELEASGFFTSPDKMPGMKINIRNLLSRMQWTEQDVNTFHGIIASLSGKKAWK